MHILELPSFFPPHGGLFCLEQAKALKAMGHEVRIVSIVELGVSLDRKFYLTAPLREERKELEGVEVFCYYMRAVPKAVRININQWVRLCQKAVDRYVRRFGKPDVLHAHCCKSAGLAAREIAGRLGIPFFISEHLSSGLFERDFGKGWQKHVWLKEKMRQAYEAAACVMPVSRELVDDLAPFFGKSYRFQPVSNIVDTDFFYFRERTQSPHFRFCCLAIADIHGKGYDVLAEAIKALPQRGQLPVGSGAIGELATEGREGAFELHIAGQGTDLRPMQELFAHTPNVHLRGHLDKQSVRELLWQSDALVLPSRSEAQPLVVLEALATGIPVVSTECVPASLRVPDACLIAPIGDASMLAERMQEVMHIAPSRAFSDAVRQMASPAVIARQLSDLFLSSM